MKSLPVRPRQDRAAFTLVEIMVSLAVLTILLLISAQVIGQVQRTWSISNSRVSQFKEARTAFDILTRNLSQATLDTYIDYDANYLATDGIQAPSRYERRSYLNFVCGSTTQLFGAAANPTQLPGHAVFFQAPLGVTNQPSLAGLDRLLCVRGYFVQFSSDAAWVPGFIQQGGGYQPRYRYRLMEYCPPAEFNQVYNLTSQAAEGSEVKAWYTSALQTTAGSSGNQNNPLATTRPVADNVVAIIISPRREMSSNDQGIEGSAARAFAPAYAFDSRTHPTLRHLLPPVVRIVLVAIDEASSQRLSVPGSSDPPFSNPIKLVSAEQMGAEIESFVTNELQPKRVNYRVFSASVALRASKFSENQTASSP
jgi:uncharacterized protein (TIGR02599 family)